MTNLPVTHMTLYKHGVGFLSGAPDWLAKMRNCLSAWKR